MTSEAELAALGWVRFEVTAWWYESRAARLAQHVPRQVHLNGKLVHSTGWMAPLWLVIVGKLGADEWLTRLESDRDLRTSFEVAYRLGGIEAAGGVLVQALDRDLVEHGHFVRDALGEVL